MKKFIVFSLACLLGLFALTGCGSSQESGPSAEDLIRADVISQFGGLFKEDGSFDSEVFLQELTQDEATQAQLTQSLEQFQIEPMAFAEAYAKKVSLTVDPIDVAEDDTATANVTLSVPALNDIVAAMTAELKEQATGSMSQEEVAKLAGEILLSEFDKEDCPITSSDLTLSYALSDGQWTMQNSDEFEQKLKGVFG